MQDLVLNVTSTGCETWTQLISLLPGLGKVGIRPKVLVLTCGDVRINWVLDPFHPQDSYIIVLESEQGIRI